jgi:hypothetical protein
MSVFAPASAPASAARAGEAAPRNATHANVAETARLVSLLEGIPVFVAGVRTFHD